VYVLRIFTLDAMPSKDSINVKDIAMFSMYISFLSNYTPLHRRGYTILPLSVRSSSVQDMFRRIFLSNYWWQKSDIWWQASYRYVILWEAFLDPSDSYFLFVDLVGFYTHWTYMQRYHKWALAHSSSLYTSQQKKRYKYFFFKYIFMLKPI
jgi:hypothetical protein